MTKSALTGALLSLCLLSRAFVYAQDGLVTPPAAPLDSAQPEQSAVATQDVTAPAADSGEAAELRAAESQQAPKAEEAELTAAQLAELGFSGSNEVPAVDLAIKLYGFIDASIMTVFGSEEWRATLQRYPSFFIGNFNLYLSKNLTETMRTFAEVRLMYLPNGSRDYESTSGAYIATAAHDYADVDRPLHWGGIEIERVYFEWAVHNHVTLRVGQFLTPYGIWNVDHGSPTIIPVARPFVIGQALFPERQTGLELLGRVALSADHSIGYHLTLSNGTGPVAEYRDLDRNKAIGWRAYWSYDGLGQLRIGTSGYWGRETAAREMLAVNAQNRITFSEKVDSQSDMLSLAADLQWRLGALLVQGEFIVQQRRFTDRGRGGAVHPLLGKFIAPKDTLAFGGYLLTGYRFGWFGVMPYLQFQTIDFVDPVQLTRGFGLGFDVGLNIRAIDSVVVKVNYLRAWWPNGYIVTDDPTNLITTQLAWAF